MPSVYRLAPQPERNCLRQPGGRGPEIAWPMKHALVFSLLTGWQILFSSRSRFGARHGRMEIKKSRRQRRRQKWLGFQLGKQRLLGLCEFFLCQEAHILQLRQLENLLGN